MRTLIRNIHTLVTCDDYDRILENADLLMEDGVFVSVGSCSAEAEEIVDGSHWIVYPGLINTHHHLPDIPSAEKIRGLGCVNLGEMNVLLLQKIEEMTLRMIEMEKRIVLMEKGGKHE